MADKSNYIDEEKAKEIAAQIPMEVTASDGTAIEETAEPQEDASAATGKPTVEEKVKEGKAKDLALTSVLGDKTIEDVIQREAIEEQDTTHKFSLSRTLGGVIIARAFQRQIGLVLLVCAFLIIYITNRYVCQKKTVEIAKIESKMTEARYKATVCTSILTEKSRESNIINLLSAYGDSTLTIPKDPPYLIQVKDE